MNHLIRTLFLSLLLSVFTVSLHADELGPSNTQTTQSTAIEAANGADSDCSQIKSGAVESAESNVLIALSEKQEPTQYGCCKTCRTGKACGDSCISRYKTCHVGPGCACDAY